MKPLPQTPKNGFDMAYTIEIVNYRGIELAQIELDKMLAFIGAPNAAGKTSIAEAITAALTREPIVIRPEVDGKVFKKAAKTLIRDGKRKATVKISDSDNTVEITYPACDVETAGPNPPSALPIVAGQHGRSIPEMDIDARREFFISFLKAVPTEEEWLALCDGNTAGEKAEKAWKAIETHGWDACAAQAQTNARDAKGQYRGITGETWGSKKGGEWRPELWENEWESYKGPEKFIERTEAAREELEGLIGKSHVTRAQADTWRDQAKDAEAKEKAFDDAHKDWESILGEVNEAQERLNAAELLLAQSPEACPWCGKPVIIRHGDPISDRPVFAKSEGDGPGIEGLEKSTAEIAEVRPLLEEKRKELSVYSELEREKKAIWALCSAAQAELDKMGDEGEEADEQATLEAREKHQRSLLDHMAYNQYVKTMELHEDIVGSLFLADAMGAAGLRFMVLKDKLEEFNEGLDAHSSNFGTPAVTIGDEMEIKYGKRPYHLISESEKLRTRVIFQTLIAELDRSSIIVVDNDVDMDRQWYFGMCKMLYAAGVPAIICARFDHYGQVPVLDNVPQEAPFAGRSYWIESAELKSIPALIEEEIKAAEQEQQEETAKADKEKGK